MNIIGFYPARSAQGRMTTLYVTGNVLTNHHKACSIYYLFKLYFNLSTNTFHQVCCRPVALLSSRQYIKMRSHCLLRLDHNRYAANCQQACSKLIVRLFIHKLDASCFITLQQVCKYQVVTSLIFTGLL